MEQRSADIVIVGGGVVGAATAFHLTRAGVADILVLEREGLACGATGICPGGIRQQFSSEADCLLARDSMRFWKEINSIVEPDHPFEFEQSGYLFLADSPGVLENFRRNVALQNRLGVPSQILTPAAVAKLLPELVIEGICGASWCAEDGFLEDCHGVTHWLMRRAIEAGAAIALTEAKRIEPKAGHWVVETVEGSIACDAVVLAAGVDTPGLVEQLPLQLPIRRLRRRLAFTEALPEQVMSPLLVAPERGFAGKQLSYGVFYLGWLRETGEEDDLDFLERGLAAGATLLPQLANLPVTRVLAGYYDQTPDSRPILGVVPGFPGLYLATGFSGHGFMIAPAVGEALARAVTGAKPRVALESFSLDRFQGDAPEEGLVI